MTDHLPKRKSLYHAIPEWVPSDAVYFLTINCHLRGPNQLAYPKIANALFESVLFRQNLRQWYAHLFLVMPDHIHGLFTFSESQYLEKSVENWKRFNATKLRIKWQRLFFEHRIRNAASLDGTCRYIITNPVRAGLVDSAEKWPFLWCCSEPASAAIIKNYVDT